MDVGTKVATAAVFLWLGMVVAISFVEAPLKFRAPGVSLSTGLGIGRLVFRALNAFEYVYAVIIAVALFAHETSVVLDTALCIVGGALLAQTVVVRPLLSRRTAAVLDGGEADQRSGAHHAYIALEVVKVAALTWTGVLLMDGW